MLATTDHRPIAVVGTLSALALLVGLVLALLDIKWALAGIGGALAVGLVLYDYRVGAVCLTVLLPWGSSPYLPQTHGFDMINFLILASTVSFAMRRLLSKTPMVPLPPVVRWCYLLPLGLGALIALPHLGEGMRNFPAVLPGEPSVFEMQAFLKTRVVKPLYFVIYAFLLANAVRNSKKPERFLLAFAVSAVLPALAIMVEFVRGGGGVADRDNYLQGLGLHPNSYGMLLALAAGPLLFLCVGAGSWLIRLGSGLAFAVVAVGLMLTGSRGAGVVFIVVIAVWLVRRHKFTDMLVGTAIAAVLSFAVPATVWDRLMLGLDEIGSESVHSNNDELTKGRIAGWAMLAPEVLESPIWGQGIGSTAWNAATTAGHYRATLAHNMYLDIVLDLGLLGLGAILYLYYRYASQFFRQSTSHEVPPPIQSFFAGAFASFIGMLAMAFTNGWWMPHPEQTFLWFSLGMTYAYWGAGVKHEVQDTAVANKMQSTVPPQSARAATAGAQVSSRRSNTVTTKRPLS